MALAVSTSKPCCAPRSWFQGQLRASAVECLLPVETVWKPSQRLLTESFFDEVGEGKVSWTFSEHVQKGRTCSMALIYIGICCHAGSAHFASNASKPESRTLVYLVVMKPDSYPWH
jgi:hypothetical protein